MKRLVIAWDLDGTLVDSSHRALVNGKFDLEFWKKMATPENIMKDKLLPLYQVFQEFQKTGFTQICVTARVLGKGDFEFFKKHNMNFSLFLHRENSLELDEVLKTKRLKDFFEKEGRLPFQAYDDKQKNLEIFDKWGFRTFNALYLNEVLKKDSHKEIVFKPKDFT